MEFHDSNPRIWLSPEGMCPILAVTTSPHFTNFRNTGGPIDENPYEEESDEPTVVLGRMCQMAFQLDIKHISDTKFYLTRITMIIGPQDYPDTLVFHDHPWRGASPLAAYQGRPDVLSDAG
jgi:hypothetical protein